MVTCSSDNYCLVGMAAFGEAMAAPAVMTVDITPYDYAVVEDPSVFYPPTKYEELQRLS